ncbi:MAG: hypothetical protein WC545_01145 [Patescibacteria group bacterium]
MPKNKKIIILILTTVLLIILVVFAILIFRKSLSDQIDKKIIPTARFLDGEDKALLGLPSDIEVEVMERDEDGAIMVYKVNSPLLESEEELEQPEETAENIPEETTVSE